MYMTNHDNMIAFPTTTACAFSGGLLCVFALGLSFVEPLVNIAMDRLLPAAIRRWSFGMRWTSHTFTFFLCNFHVHDRRLSCAEVVSGVQMT